MLELERFCVQIKKASWQPNHFRLDFDGNLMPIYVLYSIRLQISLESNAVKIIRIG